MCIVDDVWKMGQKKKMDQKKKEKKDTQKGKGVNGKDESLTLPLETHPQSCSYGQERNELHWAAPKTSQRYPHSAPTS